MSDFNTSRMPLRKGTTHDAVVDWELQDVSRETPVKPTYSRGDYRMPTDRTRGCEVFRRTVNGQLDYDYAKHVVVDCLHKVRDLLPLTDMEQLILSFCLPTVFNFVDPVVANKMKTLQFRLNDFEVMQIQRLVVDHLMAEINYAATPKP